MKNGNSIISGPKLVYPQSTLHDLFSARVQQNPHAIAIEDGEQKLSYQELDFMINKTAQFLLSEGVRSGDVVAVSLERSPELIATLFAILQCGAAYIPVDTSYPEARLKLMIEDASARFHIGVAKLNNNTTGNQSYAISDLLVSAEEFPTQPLDHRVHPTTGAYIIYTSGSTGKPKGVVVAHCNILNLLYALKNDLEITEKDKIFSVTTISFDPMVIEIYLPLLFGACVVIVDNETRLDGQRLIQKIQDDQITLMVCTPSMWQMLLNSGWTVPLNIKAIAGAEPLPLSLAKELLEKCDQVWNFYGPTETTVCSIITPITAQDELITIGKPIANTTIFLLDTDGNLVKEGEIGEIVIGGDGVSAGYLNRPELNDQLFVPYFKDVTNNRKMYRTGDLGKVDGNGQIVCLGRIDHQIKIRGYRIETGEIENVLAAIEGVKSAVVLAQNATLAAFIIPVKSDLATSDFIAFCREQLLEQLPEFMVPQRYQLIDSIPVNLNDKIDRTALFQLLEETQLLKKITIARSEEEKLISEIWEKNLEIDTIDIFSNFFELGGHSIKAVKIIGETEKRTGKKFSLPTLFEHNTVAKFAKLLHTDGIVFADCLVPLKITGSKPPIYMVHAGGLNVIQFVNMSKHFDDDQPFYAFQGVGPKGYDDWYKSIEEMAAHYIAAMLKIQPTGPYALSGFCFGGVVAFEMAKQLKAEGKVVSMTALVDTFVDPSYYYKSFRQKKWVRQYSRTRKRLIYLKQMLLSIEAFKNRINAKRNYLKEKHFSTESKITEDEQIALQKFNEAVDIVSTIVDRYQLQPQDIKVDLIRSKDHPEYDLAPLELGWKKIAKNGIDLHHIPGDNFDIEKRPFDQYIAKLLQQIAQKALYIQLNFLFLTDLLIGIEV
ncbi:hypothetical protein FFWV33_12005 [Flavobacterium faecale]|uniref:Carrier domain-containing protein n=1 Tax=Flavobacterium faecale TaxID=1355330 RepID=A0A2S1LEJ1_9FLAO|nr:amino acid adenylation domain-containing protein [Flavobacterium faecale]AWG22184.1 hypothetical protein FFWV33_12005 [Flavobacterium faecale]